MAIIFISRLFSQTLLLSLTLSLSTQECFSAGDKFPFLHLPCVFDVWHPGALTADLGKWVRERNGCRRAQRGDFGDE